MAERYQKFMLALGTDVYRRLVTIAEERGITIQELLRAIVVPEWLRLQGSGHASQTRSGLGGEKIVMGPGQEASANPYDFST